LGESFKVSEHVFIDDLKKGISDSDSFPLKVQKAWYSAIMDSETSCESKQSFFLKDAVFQYGLTTYYEGYLSKYENMVNLLPPMGFLGTVVGLLLLFVDAGGDVKQSLSSVGMGTALLTTIFALSSYIFFETLKPLLNSRAERCVKKAIDVTSKSIQKEKNAQKPRRATSFITGE
jgi:hypothetical protein